MNGYDDEEDDSPENGDENESVTTAPETPTDMGFGGNGDGLGGAGGMDFGGGGMNFEPAQAPGEAGQGPAMGNPFAGMGNSSLAGMIGGAIGTPTPVSHTLNQQQGGVLTGLAGALLDGLYAGMAPSRQAAFEAPLKMAQARQQQAQAQLMQQKAQEEASIAPVKQKLAMAQAHFQILQMDQMMKDVSIQAKAGVTKAQKDAIDWAEKNNAAEQLMQGSLAEVAKYQQDNMQNPDAINWMRKVVEVDEDNDPTKVALVKIHPKGFVPAKDIPMQFGDKTEMMKWPGGSADTYAQFMAAGMRQGFSANAKSMADKESIVSVEMPDGRREQMTKGEAQQLQSQDPGRQLNMRAFGAKEQTNMDLAKTGFRSMQGNLNDLQQTLDENTGKGTIQPVQLAKIVARNLGGDAGTINLAGLRLPINEIMGQVSAEQRMQALAESTPETKKLATQITAMMADLPRAGAVLSFGAQGRANGALVNALSNFLPQEGDSEEMMKAKIGQFQKYIDTYKGSAVLNRGETLPESYLQQKGISYEEFGRFAPRGEQPRAAIGAPAKGPQGLFQGALNVGKRAAGVVNKLAAPETKPGWSSQTPKPTVPAPRGNAVQMHMGQAYQFDSQKNKWVKQAKP